MYVSVRCAVSLSLGWTYRLRESRIDTTLMATGAAAPTATGVRVLATADDGVALGRD
jgi:hypothetical protein